MNSKNPLLVKIILLVVFSSLLVACGTVEVGIETLSPSPMVSVVSPPEESPFPTETNPPSPTPEPTISPVPDSAEFPVIVSIGHLAPFAGPEIGFLVLEHGELTTQPSPVDQQLLWEYNSRNGQLLYSPDFFHASDQNNISVTSLYVYDYATDTSQMWLEDNVLRASWSPDGERVTAAVYNPQTEKIELIFVSAPGQVDVLSECASNLYSWSPEGDRLAFVNAISWVGVKESCAGTYLVTFPNGITSPERDIQKVSDFGSQDLMGVNYQDQPIWVLDQNALIYPDQPFWIVPLDGSPAFVPATPNGEEPINLPRPFGLLWAPDLNQLVGNYDAGMSGQGGVWVYQLSEDLSRIEDYYRIGDTPQGDNSFITLVDWWLPGESILVLNGDNPDISQYLSEFWPTPAIWSLKDNVWVNISAE